MNTITIGIQLYKHKWSERLNTMKKLLNDILKVKDIEKGEGLHYSQARVYKLTTFLSLLIVVFSSLYFDINADMVENASYILFYVFCMLSGYSLTGKGFNHFNKKNNGKETNT